MKKKILFVAVSLFIGLEIFAQEDEWKFKYFADDFGEKTEEGFALYSTLGTFSNLDTANLEFWARVYVTKDEVCFKLFKYANTDNVLDTGYYNITLKNREKVLCKCQAYCPGSTGVMWISSKRKRKKILKYLTLSDLYLFEVVNQVVLKSPSTCYKFKVLQKPIPEEFLEKLGRKLSK
jgi:hypothetical protein